MGWGGKDRITKQGPGTVTQQDLVSKKEKKDRKLKKEGGVGEREREKT